MPVGSLRMGWDSAAWRKTIAHRPALRLLLRLRLRSEAKFLQHLFEILSLGPRRVATKRCRPVSATRSDVTDVIRRRRQGD